MDTQTDIDNSALRDSRALALTYDPHVCFLLDERYAVTDCNREAIILFDCQSESEAKACFAEQVKAERKTRPDYSAPSLREALDIARDLGHCAFESELDAGGRIVPVGITMKRVPTEGNFFLAVYIHDLTDLRESGVEAAARDELLQAVNTMAARLLDADLERTGDVVNESLDALLKLLDADRIDICGAAAGGGRRTFGRLYSRMSRYYKSLGLRQEEDEPNYIDFRYLSDLLQQGRVFNGLTRELPLEEQRYCREQGVLSVLLVPVLHGGDFWGYIAFADCRQERYFTATEQQVMRSVAALLASALIRFGDNENLKQMERHVTARDRLLRGINDSAALLLGIHRHDFLRTMRQSLMILGNASEGERASVWRNRRKPGGGIISARLAGWIYGRPIDEDDLVYELQLFDYAPQWDTRRREPLVLHRSEMGEAMLNYALLNQSNTLLLIPLDIQGDFWGFVGISYREENKEFTQAQIDLLRSASLMIVSAITREDDRKSLVSTREQALMQSARQHAFLARISREIRTPLNSITGLTAALRQSPDAMEPERYLHAVEDSAQLILAAVNRLLLSAETEPADAPPPYRPLDLRAFLQNVYETTLQMANRRQQILVVSYPEQNDRYILTNEQNLRRLLDNLLENAVKFTPVGGRIGLTADIVPTKPADEAKAVLRIEITDTGIGISPEQQALLFAPPADDNLSLHKGPMGLSGYGLLLCRDIVENMNGKIQIDAAPGEGTRVCFDVEFTWGLPLQSRRHAPAVADNASHYGRNWSRYRILLAEDVDINAEIIIAMLRLTDIAIETVHNGQEAVLAYQECPEDFDLIIMDVQMPVMDGIKATRQIRESGLPGSRRIPIVAMTADAFESDGAMTAKAGFTHHLTKPADIDKLFRTLDLYFGNEAK